MTTLMLLSILPVQARAANETNPAMTIPATPSPEAQAQVMLNRLNEIKAMDMSALGKAEKRQLRQEVRTIKSDMKALSGGVYLSIGAIIIIILLVILLL